MYFNPDSYKYKERAKYKHVMLIQSKFNSERDLIAKHACQTGVVPKFIRLSSNVEKKW